MNKKLKWTVGGITAALILAAIIYNINKPLSLELFEVKKQDVLSTVTEKGKLTSTNSIDIYSEVQGKVKDVYVEPGDEVTKGQKLADIDIEGVKAQIAQLKGQLEAIQGAEEAGRLQTDFNLVKQQEEYVGQAQVALKLAKDTLTRIKNLYSEGAVTSVEVEQAQADVDTKQRSLNQAQAALAQSKAQLSQTSRQNKGSSLQYKGQKESLIAQLNYLKEQQKKGQIIAGNDGTILTKNFKTGDFLNPGNLLFSIGNTSRLEIEAYVNTKDITSIKLGDSVDILFKTTAKDIPAKGEITKIAPVAEEKASALGIIEDRVKVNIALTNPPSDIKLIPGMVADVIFITQKVQNTIAVPKDALFSDTGKDYVWLIKDGKAKLAPVSKSIEGDEYFAIAEGLNEGDKIVVNPNVKELKEGVRVKP